MPDILAARGAIPDILPIYQTVPVPGRTGDVLDALEADEVDCILFTSASTVANFLEQIPAGTLLRHSALKLACIGPLTADALAAAGLPCHIRPDRASIPDLVRLLVQYL
jgi:uroporphyrinogen III methyltransferase/synthase